jgi:transcription elongation factor GreA
MAETALVPLPPDSIRSLLLTHPEILREEKENDPVALVARALREHSRALSTREIKAALTPDVVGEGEWSGWWSRTRKLLEQDPRIDHTRAFEQVYALARDERVSEVDLPTLNLANLRRCVTTIKRFLKQHPQMRERAVRQYGPPLAGEAEQAIGDELLAVLPTLAEWYPERLTDWLRLAEKGYHTGGKTTSATTPDEQERLLRLGLEGSAAKLAAFTALPSRFATVRKAALSALADSEQEWDEQTLRVISEYPSHTKEGVALIQALLNEEGGNRFSDPWHGIVSVVRLLAGKTGAEADAVLDELLSPTGSLANRLRNRACPAGVLEQIRALILSGELRFEELRRLESFFASVGQSELAHQISAQLCAAKAADAGGELPPLDMEFTYMTRAAFEVAKRRLEEMERELRRDLPAAIQKARELGDLSENAEYHAARERQGIVSSQLVALREKLLHAKCIEELQIPEGYAWPGTEVVLEDGKEGTRRTYWLLGEGDEFHGPEVISYASPVGQALLGKKEGEQVEVQEGDHRRRFRIASVKRRLPAAQE